MAKRSDLRTRSTWMSALACFGAAFTLGCGPSNGETAGGDASDPHGEGGAGGRGTGFVDPQGGSDDPCNGFDDNGNGVVDEGCSCEEGDTQACFFGAPEQVGVGTCVAGVQTCEASTSGEFGEGTWGDCVGAIGPTTEICGDGVDSDCDGSDPPCGGGGGGGGADGAGGGGDGAGGGSTGCVPTTEICGNGVDEDCNGIDDPCDDVVDVDIFLLGDCITTSCPSDHPYPVGCNVIFSPGDDRGCIASTPSNSVVYLQAGDQCNEGLIGGTLKCSTTIGAPLSAANCPINKPIPIYAPDPSGCPATH